MGVVEADREGVGLLASSRRTKLRRDPGLSVFSQDEIELLCMHSLLADTDERIFFKDREGRFLLVSAGVLATYGQQCKLEDLIGTKDSDFFTGPHAEAALADEQRVMETGEPMLAKVERETFHDRPDAWAHTTKRPLRDDDGNVIGTWGIARDITAQIEAERALSKSRDHLQASERMDRVLFEQNPQPTFIYDRSTLRFVAVNDAAREIYGYTREELLTLAITDLMPAEDVTEYLTSLQPASGNTGLGFRSAQARRHRKKDGTIVDVEVTSNDVSIDGRACRIASTQDVTERNRAAAELVVARDEAVEASNTKSAFLANISHEIRTPMNGVLGMAELLLDSDLDEDQRALAGQITSSGELMVALINDILDISKIEAGQVEMEVADFPLREMIERLCAVSRLQAEAKGLKFDLEIDDEVPQEARGDGRRLRQVLLNLVANAVKFTSTGTVAVVVHASTPPRSTADVVVRVEVTDTGIGIDPTALDRMFEPFTQADASTTRNYGGTGLGLAIARELIELMGGTVGANSNPGTGSTFWIELPLAATGQPSDPATTPLATAHLWSTSAPLVLVAEDNPVNQIVAVRTLERCGCRVDVVSDGRQALEVLATRHYDAVLMDCQMPEMDGYQATIELRRRENGERHTPIIAMTAHAMHGAAETCRRAGMDDYISKPIRRQQLIEALQRWLPQPTDTTPSQRP
jgi:PAS domain S-box-containing protein